MRSMWPYAVLLLLDHSIITIRVFIQWFYSPLLMQNTSSCSLMWGQIEIAPIAPSSKNVICLMHCKQAIWNSLNPNHFPGIMSHCHVILWVMMVLALEHGSWNPTPTAVWPLNRESTTTGCQGHGELWRRPSAFWYTVVAACWPRCNSTHTECRALWWRVVSCITC